MSKRYKGALLSATPPTTTGGTTGSGSAGGVWTLQQEMQAKGNNAWPEAGNYVEDVFSTYLYNGTGAAGNVVSNGVDLSTKGGLVWLKQRSGTATSHTLMDTAQGTSVFLSTNNTNASSAFSVLSSFNTNGFTIGQGSVNNASGQTYASWTFRKQPKFFDVVTWTGDGAASKTISHSLGSTPGFIVTKRTDTTGEWWSYHTSLGNNKTIRLNSTSALTDAGADLWGVTSTTFTASSTVGANTSGGTYVAYIFAHDAGGFGLTGTDNVISCGSVTTNGSGNATVNLGFEPQFVIAKSTNYATDWYMYDSMRGFTVNASGDAVLKPNVSNAESTSFSWGLSPTANGFTVDSFAGGGATFDIIYIAIRRGPMKVPTDGTKVFKPIFSTTAGAKLTTGFPVDMQFEGYPPGDSLNMAINDRLRGVSTNTTQSTNILKTSSTAAESAPNSTMTNYWDNTGFTMPGYYGGIDYISWSFGRAPSFFDEVCYTGTGSQLNVSHNLGAVPELMIVRVRNKTTAENWCVYSQTLGAGYFLALNTTSAKNGSFDSTRFPVAPTSSVFTVGSDQDNGGAFNYVAYLFATCPGVSKVGSYTGTGTTKQVDCGFAAGARFVMIKRTDSTGAWYVWDTARGIVSGNDPYLLLNSTAAEVTTTDYIDTYSAGFELSSTAPAALNASGGTYIFLAIA